MAARFTLGIEEEFQLVNRQSGDLCSCIQTILDKKNNTLGESIKPEMLQSTVELISDVCPDIKEARRELISMRRKLLELVDEEGLDLVSAGTHPTALWQDQARTEHERYEDLEDEYQDIGRSLLIFGMHVHVGVDNKEQAITYMNQVRTWLPHLLAFSSNSPFWSGRNTGLKSYRSVVWKRFPRSGMPEMISSRRDYDHFVQTLVDMESIDNAKKIWWDIRPHPFFDTLEFRICDMPPALEDTLAIVALCQAMIAKLTWVYEHGMSVPSFSRDLIEENKWRAMRYGLDAEVLDFAKMRRLSMRDSFYELLDFVDEVVDDLGSRNEINYIRSLLDKDKGQGSGADRQLAIYKQTNDPQKVIAFLAEQTRVGVI